MNQKTRSLGEILQEFSQHRQVMQQELQKVIVGQNEVIEQLLAAIFARGHCLLVGVPGLAKTLMVSTLARILDLEFKRIQFTPDLMPSDITGTDVLEEDEHGRRRLPVRRRADLHQHPAGRRNQPHAAQDPGRAAGGHAGARGDGRAARPTRCPSRSSSWPRRIPSSRKGPIRCPKRSSTGSCSTSTSATPRETRKSASSGRPRGKRRPKSARCFGQGDRQPAETGDQRGGERVHHQVRRAAGAGDPAEGRTPRRSFARAGRLGGRPPRRAIPDHGGKALAAMDGRFSVALDDIRKIAIPVLRHRLSTNSRPRPKG